MKYQILQGDNRETLKTIPDNSIDAIVTDPPYGISFLGKDWDSFRNSKVTKNSTVKNLGSGMRMTTAEENLNFQLWCEEWAKECFRVLKPGGYMLSFSAARMYHRMTVGLEDAGFEIRDQIMWIYSSGFPKSQDVGRSIQRNENKDGSEWLGWGTALKPGHEPIALARKPTKLSYAGNVQHWATGALNIDATRVEGDRFPSNVLGDIPDYQKYFYCPKVSRKERHVGFENPPDPLSNYSQGDVKNHPLWDPSIGTNVQRLKHKILEHNKTLGQEHQVQGNVGNNHPTVKPVALMEYLIKLITPPGGTVLDPFNGSGSTGMAAVGLGYDYIGCELDPAYVDITQKRIAAWLDKDNTVATDNNFTELFDATE